MRKLCIISVRIAGVLAKIQTKYFPNTQAQQCKYFKLLYEIVSACTCLVVVEMDRFYTDSHFVRNACRNVPEVRVPVCIADQHMVGWWKSQSTNNGYTLRHRQVLIQGTQDKACTVLEVPVLPYDLKEKPVSGVLFLWWFLDHCCYANL